jgi:ferritin-like metal-binding protein YciE
MVNLKTLNDGLVEQLKDLYSAEKQLVKELPKMKNKATSKSLRKALESHITDTENQIKRLDEISEILGIRINGYTCKAMQGLIEETKQIFEENTGDSSLIDVQIVASATKIEHYEIAAYNSTIEISKQLDNTEITELLRASLVEEKDAERLLSSIAKGEIIPEASSSTEKSISVSKKPRNIDKVIKNLGNRSSKRESNAKNIALLVALSLSLVANLLVANAQDTNSYDSVLDEAKGRYSDNEKSDNENTENNSLYNNLNKNADEQGLSGGNNLEVLAKIRSSIIKNDELSMNGHNIKIIVDNKLVTLTGPVDSIAEKDWIYKTAKKIAVNYTVLDKLSL